MQQIAGRTSPPACKGLELDGTCKPNFQPQRQLQQRLQRRRYRRIIDCDAKHVELAYRFEGTTS